MLLGEPFKFEGRPRDELTWICEAGPGLFTHYASGECSVTLRLRPMEKSNAMELGVVGNRRTTPSQWKKTRSGCLYLLTWRAWRFVILIHDSMPGSIAGPTAGRCHTLFA